MMIIIRRTGFLIDDVDDLKKLSDQDFRNLQLEESYSGLDFHLKDGLNNNRSKRIYKVGFLTSFLRLLYPDRSFSKIVNILNNRYDVFLSRRQIERIYSEYISE